MPEKLFRFPDRSLDTNAEFIPKIKVAVVSACSGAGGSYVCSQILKNGLISMKTPSGLRSLIELGKPYFYVALGMEKRFLGRRFFDFASGGKYETNIEMGINWYVRKPGSELSPMNAIKAVSMTPGSLLVFDCSGAGEELVLSILPEMDMVYLVLDPSPVKLLESEGYIEKIKNYSPKYTLIVNKYSQGIHKGQLSAFLGTQNYEVLPAVDLKSLHKAEYNCVLP